MSRIRKGMFMIILQLTIILLLAGGQPAMAYVGPGLGLGAIGAILGVILSVLLAVFAIVWYPVKRMLGLGKKAGARSGAGKKDV